VIEGKTILCFASGYDAPPTSKHHVMHLLAERNVVLWINYHASRAPTASGSDLLYMARKLAQVARGRKQVRENLHVLTPLVIPLPSSRWAQTANRRLLIDQVRWALRAVGRGPVQLWTFTPDIGYVLGRFGEEKVVYYCVDDHAQFTGYDTRRVLAEEADLCRRSDLVITTSRTLQDAKAPLNPNTVLVPHGVEYQHFARAADEDLPVPADLAEIPHPRLGFFGLIRDWVNIGMLAEIARRRPQWHFVIIGDATFDLSDYRRLPNMHFLGRKPYQDLPGYCRGFDVGLIPFQVNELTRAVNPIKLREYLSAGLGVVSTPMPEVQLYEHLIEIADGPGPFADAIERVLSADPAEVDRRRRAMSEETWPAKLETICARLDGRP
jgi:glycosyltransferase involved in cell wall biosynthesis